MSNANPVRPISEIRRQGIHNPCIYPTFEFSDDEYEEAVTIANSWYRTGYTDPQKQHNNIPSIIDDDADYSVQKQESKQVIRTGALGQMAFAGIYERDWRSSDDSVQLYGDSGTDIVVGDWQIDVKTNRYGWSNGVEPVLKIDRSKHEKNDHLDAYHLMEQISAQEYRSIGFIYYDDVAEVGTKIDEGEVYKPDDPRYNVPSRRDNWFVDNTDLIAVFPIPE